LGKTILCKTCRPWFFNKITYYLFRILTIVLTFLNGKFWWQELLECKNHCCVCLMYVNPPLPQINILYLMGLVSWRSNLLTSIFHQTYLIFVGQRRTNSQQKSGRPARGGTGGRRGQYAIEEEPEEESKSPFSAFFGLAR